MSGNFLAEITNDAIRDLINTAFRAGVKWADENNKEGRDVYAPIRAADDYAEDKVTR